MSELRIGGDAQRPRLIAYREETRGSPPPPPPARHQTEEPFGVAPAPPMRERYPPAIPLPPQQTVSPAFVARTYQANIPTHLYTYPAANHQESVNATGNYADEGEMQDTAVTLVPYERGSLVDRYA